ncbi:MAG: acyltransferase family protein [Psychroserpens sp.]|nr:acyltransferase family protein [Psychroserpens sp.]
MKTIPHKTERLHALDSLRAIMMMLGLVLHSVITYVGGEPYASWPIRDPNNYNTNLEVISSTIHVFRMPIFMVVAGFFAALLFYERGSKKMFKNRMNRILLPFLVFVVVLFPFVRGGMRYTLKVFEGNINAFSEVAAMFASFSDFIPARTMHLWFLYYLIMFSLGSYMLGLLFQKLPKISQYINKVFYYIFEKPILRLIVFSGITLVLLLLMDRSWVATSTSFVPDFNTFIFYFFFYMFGWLLFKSKSLLGSFKQYDWAFTIIALAGYIWYFFIGYDFLDPFLIKVIKATCCWLLIFGVTGLFIRYGSNHSARMRYVSDSSYWVYLLHLPLTIIIPALIADWNISGTLKFLFVTSSTAVICFVSYHYLVRNSFIGKFLNGRTYPRQISAIRQAYEAEKLKVQFDK